MIATAPKSIDFSASMKAVGSLVCDDWYADSLRDLRNRPLKEDRIVRWDLSGFVLGSTFVCLHHAANSNPSNHLLHLSL